jgi:TRAP-type C4-dicarboxylate transport system permease small subunit
VSAFLTFDRLVLLVTSIMLAALTAAMTVVVLLGVFTRYVLNDALPWTEELARYILIWLSWLGGGIAMRRGSHIAVDLFIDKLSPRVRSVIKFLGRNLVLLFLVICIVYGLDLARRVGMQSTIALGISMQIPYASVPVGAALMLYHLLVIMFVPLPSRQRDLQTEIS